MQNLSRFAVFAVMISENEELIRAEQRYLTHLTGNRLALAFPVHITLKGRFLADKNTVITTFKNTVTKILEKTKIEFPPLPKTIHISNAKYVNSQLSWLEVLPNTQGFYTLLYLHSTFEKEMNGLVVIDEVPEEHKNSNFCPHITLGWGVTLEVWEKYLADRKLNLNQSQIKYIALASYPQNWQLGESINLILKIPL